MLSKTNIHKGSVDSSLFLFMFTLLQIVKQEYFFKNVSGRIVVRMIFCCCVGTCYSTENYRLDRNHTEPHAAR